MKKTIKSIVSIILVLSMLLSTSVVAFAKSEEIYLSELRIVYANSYDEAKQVLTSSKLEDYQIFNENLNNGSGEIGVWLAYKTTTNVDDAITDIAIMQMGGGYSEGNFQEMIKASKEEYTAMGDIYLEAIEYFTEAYEADNFLAKSAYRQLNFYTGLDDYDEDKLGDIMVSGELTASELATLFMQGNTYVLNNVRSLLAMGVSYNEDGMHYLERVEKIVSEMGEGEGYEPFEEVDVELSLADEDELELYSALIAPNLPVFRNMFEELEAYESELNYEDEEFTDLEIKYAEYKAMAEMMRAVDYLDGKTLYDFCMEYELNTSDYSAIYPLAAALNNGQAAMTKAAHYYDVVRYSMTDYPEETINAELEANEKIYSEVPFNVYAGVDREMFKGNFALTSAASRADAYTDSNTLSEALFGNGAWKATGAQIAAGAVGVGLFTWAIIRTSKGGFGASKELVKEATRVATSKANFEVNLALSNAKMNVYYLDTTFNELESYYGVTVSQKVRDAWETATFYQKTETLNNIFAENGLSDMVEPKEIAEAYNSVKPVHESAMETAKKSVENAVLKARLFTGALYILGATSVAYSAYSLYKKIHDYYNPTYDVVPEALVDLIDTVDGDRYIKYDAVLEATVRDKKAGKYHPGDLNAYEAQRWNAVYYTKSYEAGKPLLADFALSNVSNKAGEGYLPVHRFGEVVCYDLNKYNFKSSSDIIYLSVAQSENQKSAVADVPDIVGSVFGTGFLFLAGGLGLAIGAGATVGVQSVLKKKKETE